MTPVLPHLLDLLLALGLTARLTHAITVEDIGERTLRAPALAWAHRPEHWPQPDHARAAKRYWWADALSCPWCVSTWIGLLSALALVLAHLGPDALHLAYRVVAGGLTLSFITALIQINSEPYDDPEPTPPHQDEDAA